MINSVLNTGFIVLLDSIKRGQLAEMSGCHSETIRYYEQIGLLSKPRRGSNGYRYYNENHLQRLRLIRKSKQLGFDNENIRELIEISQGIGRHTRAEVKHLTENHIELIRQRIVDLKKMEKTLSKISTQCDGAEESVDHCPILLSLFNDDI